MPYTLNETHTPYRIRSMFIFSLAASVQLGCGVKHEVDGVSQKNQIESMSPVDSPQGAHPTDSRMDKARRLSELGQFEQASMLLEEELAETPENPEALERLAVVLLLQGLPKRDSALLERASRTLRAAATLAPERRSIAKLLGYIELRRGESALARTALSKCAGTEAGCAALLLQANLQGAPDGSALSEDRTSWSRIVCLDVTVPLPGAEEVSVGPAIAVTATSPVRIDTKAQTEPLAPFEIIYVEQVKDGQASFTDRRRSDLVTKTGWVQTCTASGNRAPPCSCRAGATGEAAFAGAFSFSGVVSKPGKSGRLVLGRTAAIQAGVRQTGKSEVINIGLGVNVRWCQLAWSVEAHVAKRVPVASLRPLLVPPDKTEMRAILLRRLSQEIPASAAEAIASARWCVGMPIALISEPLGIDFERPSDISLSGEVITEEYAPPGVDTRVTVRDGRVVAISTPSPAATVTPEFPQQVPPPHPSSFQDAAAHAIIEPSSGPNKAAVLASPKPLEDMTHLATAEASSTLPPWRAFTFAAKNLIDGQLETSWQPNAKPTLGAGEWFTLRFARPVEIHELRVANGHA